MSPPRCGEEIGANGCYRSRVAADGAIGEPDERSMLLVAQNDRLNRWMPAAVPITGATRFATGTRNSTLVRDPIKPCSPRVDLSQARRDARSPCRAAASSATSRPKARPLTRCRT